MRLAVHRRTVCFGVFCALALSSAAIAASVPFPEQRQGSGNEALSGGGIFAGDRYRPQSAFVRWDRRLQVLDLYLVRGRLGCASLDAAAADARRIVQVGLSHRAARLRVGVPLAKAIVEFIEHPRSGPPRIRAAQTGVRIVLTRVDTGRGGIWHGRLTVRPRAIERRRFGYDGTFAARWCSR